MTFPADNFRRAVADYDRSWRATDEALYDLCRRHPGHADQAGVNAKLWIIGRTTLPASSGRFRPTASKAAACPNLPSTF